MKNEYDSFLQKLALEQSSNFAEIENIDYHDRLTLLRCSRAKYVLKGYLEFDKFKFYKEVLTYKYIAENEWKTDYYIKNDDFNGIDEGIINFLKAEQCIITTFHLGSYFSIAGCLSEIIPKISIVIDNKTYIHRQKEFERYNFTNNDSVLIINIESIDGFKRLLKAISDGYSILFYADGNTGIGGVKNTANSIDIPLFNCSIKVKSGIAALSHKYSLPILPILTHKNKELHNEYISHPPIMPCKSKTRNEYIEATTKNIWNTFAEHLLKYPTQWECWLYLHRFHLEIKKMPIYSSDLGTMYTLNPMCDFYIDNDMHCVYNLGNDSVVLVSRYIYKLLSKLKQNNSYISQNKITDFISNKDVLDILLDHEILICS